MTVDAHSPVDEGRTDADLISAVREGDSDAYGELYGRHHVAAERLARQLLRGPDADDLVAEAFTKVLVTLQKGGGPQESFRAYLLTAVRRLHIDRIRAVTRERPTEDTFELDGRVEFVDTAELGFERTTTAEAFASLPERWQMVLWHLDVEGQKPAEIAPLLGMSANSVSALAYRAREGLRQAYLQKHLAPATSTSCRHTIGNLGAYVRGGLARRDSAKVKQHLDDCRSCMGLYVELQEFNSGMAGILAPVVLGTAAAGYLQAIGSGGGLVGAGGLLGGQGGNGGGGGAGAGAGAAGGSTSGLIGAIGTFGPAGVAAGAAASVVVIAGAAALMTVETPPDRSRDTIAVSPPRVQVDPYASDQDTPPGNPPWAAPTSPEVLDETDSTDEDDEDVDDPTSELPSDSEPGGPTAPEPPFVGPTDPAPSAPAPTPGPSEPTTQPTTEPTPDDSEETETPATGEPAPEPTDEPTVEPSPEPTESPTIPVPTEPTTAPTTVPTTEPTTAPTTVPTTEPTTVPTTEPTTVPTTEPTTVPTTEPSTVPTTEPTTVPTTEPTTVPTTTPTTQPTTAPIDRTVSATSTTRRVGLFDYAADFEFTVGRDVPTGASVSVEITFTGGLSAVELITGVESRGWTCERTLLSPVVDCTRTVDASRALPRITVSSLLAPHGTWVVTTGGQSTTGSFG